jgi:hypothetical protein
LCIKTEMKLLSTKRNKFPYGIGNTILRILIYPNTYSQKLEYNMQNWAYLSTCYAAYMNAWKTYHKEMHVQMVFLMMNTWCSKHVEDTKKWIKTLI